ncbi:MAG: hypothetical protein WCF23_18965 [Candidatus Nitrosopolaris sp.]
MIPLADVAHSSNIISGHVSISSPTGSSSDHLKLVAAEITDAGSVACSHCKLYKDIGYNNNRTIDISCGYANILSWN